MVARTAHSANRPTCPAVAEHRRADALQDANYNVVALADENGNIVERYAYSPYGKRVVLDPDFTQHTNPTLGSYNFPIGHQGLRHDDIASGTASNGGNLIYNRARMLHPTLGRFVQRDPAGYVDGRNLYQYVRSKPGFILDPSGMESYTVENVNGESDRNTTHYVDEGIIWDNHVTLVAGYEVKASSVVIYATSISVPYNNFTGNPDVEDGVLVDAITLDKRVEIEFSCTDDGNISAASDGEANSEDPVSAGVSGQVEGGDGSEERATVQIQAEALYEGSVTYAANGGGLSVTKEPDTPAASISGSATFKCTCDD